MTFNKHTAYFFLIGFLIVFFPWELLSPGRFEDLFKYKEYLSLGVRHEETLFNAPLIFLFKEIVFQQSLFFFYDFIQDIDYAILANVVIITFIFLFATLRLGIDYRILILLLCPLMIDFFNAQLRNSLAVSLFLLGCSFKKNSFKYLFFFVSITFHLGALLVIMAYVYVNFLKRINNKTLHFFLLLFFSLACAFGDKLFFILLDDPRMDVYGSSVSGMSAIYFIWALALFACFLLMKIKSTEHDVKLDLALIGSLLVVLAYFSGAYYGRYLAMFFAFILLAIGRPRMNKGVFWVMLFYSGYTFVMNFVF